MTVDSWFDYWFNEVKGSSIRYNTRVNYEAAYRNHIKGEIGSMSISDVKQFHCQRIMNKIKEETPGYIKTARIVLNGLFDTAVANELIQSSPMEKSVECKKPTPQKERRVLTMYEHVLFLDYFTKNKQVYQDAFEFVLNTGLRCGELSGLKWSDVDFEKRCIHISRTLFKDDKRNLFVEGPPKTRTGDRIIPLTTRAYEILIERKRQKSNEKIIPIIGADYIFTNSVGKPVPIQNYNKALSRIADQIGIEPFSMHTLRHTFATRCIEGGIKPKTLQTVLGHATLAMTMDLYVHVTDDEIKSEMNKLNFVVV